MRSFLPRVILVVAVATTMAAPGFSGEVEVKRRADGTLLIVNHSRPRPRFKSRPMRPTPEIARWIDHYSRRRGLDPSLVRAVIQVESGYDVLARSRKGAMGLMQLMPQTARELGVRNPWDPGENIRGGTSYLRRMLDSFGDVELALAGYNAGPSAVERYGRIPPYPETTRYVGKVMSLYRGSSWTPSGAQYLQPERVATPSPKRPVTRPVIVKRDANNRILLVTP